MKDIKNRYTSIFLCYPSNYGVRKAFMLTKLDTEQYKLATAKEDYVLGIAGAGTGKTFTLLGRLDYLLRVLKINPSTILCLSYTREASFMLEHKIKNTFGIPITVMTFHKLGLSIIGDTLTLCPDNYLEDTLNYYFQEVFSKNKHCTYILFILFHKVILTSKQYLSFLKTKKFLLFQRELLTYLKLFKTNGYSLKDFTKLFSKTKCSFVKKYTYKKVYYLLIQIYQIYQNRLIQSGSLDFDDMLILSKKKILSKEVQVPYQYLLVDEFQDISVIRFNLIEAIIKVNHAQLFAVGDDYQSIYQFSGSKIESFLHFQELFPTGKIYKIQRTYRNSQELVSIAGAFVQRNQLQIHKELVSSIREVHPIQILLCSNEVSVFHQLVNELYQIYRNHILVLGRNTFSIKRFLVDGYTLKDEKICFKEINIPYLTVHKSKGLEEDVVILIDCNDSLYGFPNQLKISPLLNIFSYQENINYAEERRLFYVALTRTKSKIYILASKENPSIFIKELIFRQKIKPTYR